MPVRLDEVTPHGEVVDLVELRDRVLAAETAIRHWDQELASRVRDVQALDAWWLAALTSVLGTREQRIEAGLARVKDARARLAEAKRALERAQADLGVAEGRAREAADLRAEQVMRRESFADAIRGTAHPAAPELSRLEAEISSTRAEIELRTEVVQAAMGALGALNAVLRASGKAEEAAGADLLNVPFAELQKLTSFRSLRGELQTWREKAGRLEAALADLGLTWTAGGQDAEVPSAFWQVQDDLVTEYRQFAHMRDLRSQFDGHREELKGLMEGLDGERRAHTARVDGLEAERARLLDRWIS